MTRQPRTVLPPISEDRFQRQVVMLAQLHGWHVWHDAATNAPRRCPCCRQVIRLPRNAEGWPDLVLVRPPRLILAELKSEAGRPTEAQQVWLEALGNCPGVEVYLWRPSDWPTIESTLSQTLTSSSAQLSDASSMPPSSGPVTSP